MSLDRGKSLSHRRPVAGMTALELLVALVLASLLLGSVSGLLRILAARQKTLVGDARFAAWHRPLLERLRWDLDNARQFELAPDHLRLVGYGGRDEVVHAPTHRPTEVLYRLARVGEQVWLVREETQLDGISNKNRRTELVCSGITALAMEVPGEQTPMPRRSGFLPDRCRLLLMGESSSIPLLVLQYCP